ncbi:MAG: hypothetical protein AAB549_02185 [Patescibacteria group bacterium]
MPDTKFLSMNQKNLPIFSIFFGALIVGSFLFGFFLQKQLSQPSKLENVVNTNVNLVVEPESVPWWYGEARFQKGEYFNPGCNFALRIPSGLYLQQQQYTSGDKSADYPGEQPYCFTQFGNDQKDWQIQVISRMNKKNETLETWNSQQMQYDVPFKPRKFGEVQTLFLERAPQDVAEESYMQQALAATEGWVHTFIYNDRNSARPHREAFVQLVTSLRAYTSHERVVGLSGTKYMNTEIGISLIIPEGWAVSEIGGAAASIAISGEPGSQGQQYQVRIAHTLSPTGTAEPIANSVAENAKGRGAIVKKVIVGKNNQYIGYRVDNLFGGDVNLETTYLNNPKATMSIERPSRKENDNYPNAIQDYNISEVMMQTLTYI